MTLHLQAGFGLQFTANESQIIEEVP